MILRNGLEAEILESWDRCIRLGLKRTLTSPRYCLDANERERILLKKKALITVSHKCFEKIRPQLPRSCYFLLTDPEAVVLHQEKFTRENDEISMFLPPGSSLVEESCGSNPVCFALRLKRAVCFKPEYHYCDLFRGCFTIAAPLLVGEKMVGCLLLAVKQQSVVEEMIDLALQLREGVVRELDMIEQKPKAVKLSKNQLNVLHLMAQGLTNEQAASEMNLSVNTIKYHKKQIFCALEVQSTTEAVAKAIKRDLLADYKVKEE